MNDLITAATSGLFVEIGKVIEHMKAQQARIADLERQLAEASAPAVDRKPLGWLRRWAFDGEKPRKEKGKWVAKFRLLPITQHQAFNDDVPLYAAPAADTDKVREALKLAIRQNSCDMLMTGEEIRKCEAALHSMAAQAPVREVPGWQPIDTAPKDGSHVLCYAPELQFVGFYGDPINKWCYMAPGVPVAPTQPTHWMPLPAAPVQQEGE